MKANLDEAGNSGLATDLYQLTMAAAYHANGRSERASFELFARKLPKGRSYLMVAGLEQALGYLQGLSFSADEIEYLRGLPAFSRVSAEFFDYLRDFRFTGEAWAMPEGTVAFAGEPLLRVTAPLIEAQIVETYLLATVNFQTLIATKAARIVDSAQGRGIVEFGARRAHGFDAAVHAARAAFIGGCVGTSNVKAGKAFGLPAYGTAAHSFTMAFDREIDAFRAFFNVFPESCTLLLDTYDTIAAAQLATEFGPKLRGVRLDSGDLLELSKRVRAILDEGGLRQTKIFASGDLNEFKIAELVAAGAPIDMFGVGTDLSTSRDAPALGGVYKLVEIDFDGRPSPKMKLSRDKATYPYCKQVWRVRADDGSFVGDVIGRADETDLPGEPLLELVMRDGRIVAPLPGLREAQERGRRQLASLPERHRRLTEPQPYPVRYSDKLEQDRMILQSELEKQK
ncbi:MAG TPA: nicotinate phosphoribosyltransferase [Blastocatellia bacterium]